MTASALGDLTHNPMGCDLAPDLNSYRFLQYYFLAFLFRVFVDAGACLLDDPEVGGKIASSLHIPCSSIQCSLSTLFRVRLFSLMLSKLKGPDNLTDGSIKANYVAHCINFFLLGMTDGLNNTRSPYIICWVVSHRL